MGSSLLSSAAMFRVLFLVLNSLWLFPELASAGITRHYKFNVFYFILFFGLYIIEMMG